MAEAPLGWLDWRGPDWSCLDWRASQLLGWSWLDWRASQLKYWSWLDWMGLAKLLELP